MKSSRHENKPLGTGRRKVWRILTFRSRWTRRNARLICEAKSSPVEGGAP